MAAKTLRKAIDQGIRMNKEFIAERIERKLREDIANEIRDFMAHEMMIYGSQYINSVKDPVAAELVSDAILGLHDRLFAGIPAFTTVKDKDEYEKGN